MQRLIDTLPGLKRAALEIAYDNGMINRFQPEDVFLDGVENIITADGMYAEDLEIEDAWLQTLSEEDMETLCAGEEGDILALLSTAPTEPRIGPDKLPLRESINGLLNDIFNYDYGQFPEDG